MRCDAIQFSAPCERFLKLVRTDDYVAHLQKLNFNLKCVPSKGIQPFIVNNFKNEFYFLWSRYSKLIENVKYFTAGETQKDRIDFDFSVQSLNAFILVWRKSLCQIQYKSNKIRFETTIEKQYKRNRISIYLKSIEFVRELQKTIQHVRSSRLLKPNEIKLALAGVFVYFLFAFVFCCRCVSLLVGV